MMAMIEELYITIIVYQRNHGYQRFRLLFSVNTGISPYPYPFCYVQSQVKDKMGISFESNQSACYVQSQVKDKMGISFESNQSAIRGTPVEGSHM